MTAVASLIYPMTLAFAPPMATYTARRAPAMVRMEVASPAASSTDMGVISVGQLVPDVEVEISTVDPAMDRDVARYAKLSEVLGAGTSVLIGMPGAFTPTCTDRHLPGFYAQGKALANQGVNSVNVITNNDRYVNVAWNEKVEDCAKEAMAANEDGTEGGGGTPIGYIADPRGDVLEQLGMIGYLGRDLGIRSKRFAVVVEGGMVRHVAVDEGSTELESTSAEAILEVVTKLEMERRRVAAEYAAAAELYKMDRKAAAAYLTESKDALLAAGVDASELEQCIAIVSRQASSGGSSGGNLAVVAGGLLGALAGVYIAVDQGYIALDIATTVASATP